MVDIDLIVQTLRNHGHDVQGVHHVPDNAGDYEFTIDGKAFNLEGARGVLEQDELKVGVPPQSHAKGKQGL
ncbi:MAG TPA: hypothetical protein VIX90_16690 [Edaphobacter sp.]